MSVLPGSTPTDQPASSSLISCTSARASKAIADSAWRNSCWIPYYAKLELSVSTWPRSTFVSMPPFITRYLWNCKVELAIPHGRWFHRTRARHIAFHFLRPQPMRYRFFVVLDSGKRFSPRDVFEV